MITLAGLFIFAFETRCVWWLYEKYFGPYTVEAKWEEFFREASLEDIVKMIGHLRMSFLGLCIATMGRLFS